MKATVTTDHAVRIIFDIAYHGGGGSTQLLEISRRQNIGPRYLEQVLQKLRNAGLIGSRRGPTGGYYLLRKPSDLSFYDVLAAVEGPVESAFCCDGEEAKHTACDASRIHPTHDLWKAIGVEVAAVLRGSTFLDVCRQAEAMDIERESDARFILQS